MKELISQLLLQSFWPTYLKVVDQSHMHKGHRGVDRNADTHFFVTVVSSVFEGLSLVQRHKKIYETLKQPLDEGVHALKIDAKTPEEFFS